MDCLEIVEQLIKDDYKIVIKGDRQGWLVEVYEVNSGYQVADAESRDVKEAIWLAMLRTYGMES